MFTLIPIYNWGISNEIWKQHKRCVYIYISEFKSLQIHSPTDPFYTIKFNTTCYYKEVYYTICLKRKVHTKLQKNTQQLPSTQKNYTYYSTWGGGKREWWVIALLSEWIIHIHRIGLRCNQLVQYHQSHSFNTKKII